MPYKNPEQDRARRLWRYHNDPKCRLQHYLRQRKYTQSQKGKAARARSAANGTSRHSNSTRQSATEHRNLLYEALLILHGPACGICGTLVDRATICIDHIIAIVDGGARALSNVQLAHRKCNAKKESDAAKARTLKRLEAIVNVRD